MIAQLSTSAILVALLAGALFASAAVMAFAVIEAETRRSTTAFVLAMALLALRQVVSITAIETESESLTALGVSALAPTAAALLFACVVMYRVDRVREKRAVTRADTALRELRRRVMSAEWGGRSKGGRTA